MDKQVELNAKLAIWGGAGEHGRSCYFLQNGSMKVLLDCGAKKVGQGEYPLLPTNHIPTLNAVFLSHSHEDHSMAIPLLYKLGYQGKVWTTRATMQKLPYYFSAWKKYVDRQSGNLPYSSRHMEKIQYACLEDIAAPGQWIELSPGLRIYWGKSGHIIGSIWLILDLNGKFIFFSGDFTTEGRLLSSDWLPAIIRKDLAQVQSKKQELDLAIIEAAHGLDTENQLIKLNHLTNTAQRVLTQNGWLLLPVPVVGRGQDLLVWAMETFPNTRLLVEETIADNLKQLLQWPHWLRPGAAATINSVLNNPQLRIIKIHQQREQLLSDGQNGIILTDDGMLQTATARWYYQQLESHPNNCVVFTGHLPAGSQGQQLLSPGNLQGTAQLISYKVHQGLSDLRQMLNQLPSRQTVLVHTNKPTTDLICAKLSQENYSHLYSLSPGEYLNF
ncbi:putative metal-dependent RNase [Sporomusaceae bacterium BoRhaA]|uniref:MBL fold metallo-hydrolase n=1 Tax=Pelorhabdus rhamnosifermentans TaxID=2772457 RepID=UPI001C0626F1|nr:MBL fold metallo-hydrolase [Pelorhabdus rhamnosifermentans]MBU2703549.1 putative metal-dependent RNase [Pelorhabdus rhamnosifermentans]